MDVKKDVLNPQMKDAFNLLNIIDCFELKLHLLKRGYAEKNEYERNELDIENMKCQIAIFRLQKAVLKKIKELKDNIILFEFSQND